MEGEFIVKTGAFEGPLDLLLSLVEKRKLFVGDVSLADVADEYLSYIQNLPELPVSDVAQFILVASTLVLIKSRSLIPELSLSEEEEEDISDLEMRLALYKEVRGFSEEIKDSWGRKPLFSKEPSPRVPVFTPDEETTLEGVVAAVVRVWEAFPRPEKLPETIVKKVISIEEAITDLTKRITTALSMSFRDFGGQNAPRKEVAVRFLAMLELVKQGVIDVAQERLFGDISMESQHVGTPKY